jgi:ribosomal protein S8
MKQEILNTIIKNGFISKSKLMSDIYKLYTKDKKKEAEKILLELHNENIIVINTSYIFSAKFFAMYLDYIKGTL